MPDLFFKGRKHLPDLFSGQLPRPSDPAPGRGSGTFGMIFSVERGPVRAGFGPVVPPFGHDVRSQVAADENSLRIIAPRAAQPAPRDPFGSGQAAVAENETHGCPLQVEVAVM